MNKSDSVIKQTYQYKIKECGLNKSDSVIKQTYRINKRGMCGGTLIKTDTIIKTDTFLNKQTPNLTTYIPLLTENHTKNKKNFNIKTILN